MYWIRPFLRTAFTRGWYFPGYCGIIRFRKTSIEENEVMASPFLPSLWSKQDVNSLQTVLAKALVEYFYVTAKGVHVITSIVDSGMVVENGAFVEW